MLLQHLEARHVGQPQVEHHAVDRLARAAARAPRRRCRRVTMSMSSWPSSSVMLSRSRGVVLDDQQALAARLRVVLDARERAPSRPSVVVGLVRKEKAPRARPCWRSSSRVTICTGMWRVAGSCLSWLSTVQPSMSGRKTSSETAVGWYCARERQRVGAAHGDQHLEARVVGEVDQDARVVRIVLDDQQHGVAGLRSSCAVVRDLLDRLLGEPWPDGAGRARRAADCSATPARANRADADVGRAAGRA